MIEVDDASHLMYYIAPSVQPPLQIPASATELRMDLLPRAQGTLVPVTPYTGAPYGMSPVTGTPTTPSDPVLPSGNLFKR